MSEKCPPNYKNLNEIQSFSEQRYATVQWAEQNCENDEYLKQEVDELNYKSPARIRKRWNPIIVDSENSYGYSLNSDNTVSFSNETSKEFTVDFGNMKYIDENKSDCDFKTYKDGQGKFHRCATIPTRRVGSDVTNCRSPVNETWVNSFWYVGYDKSKPYHIRPDWIKDPFDSEIPSVCRAQTIKIPKYDQNGNEIRNAVLSSVDLRIENNGTNNSNWGSPLYVQLWKTKKVTVKKTAWDSVKKREVPVTGHDEIYYPFGTPKSALATAVFQPDTIQPKYYNFQFDKKIVVQGDEHYALVMLSPLSHWEHCPRIGGWGRNCDTDKDPNGDAFLSEDNGRTWQRYGKTDLSIGEYKMGQLTPADFRFSARIQMFTEGYVTGENFYLYLKPIHLNPIKSLQLVPVGYGNEAQLSNIINMEFQVSKSGKADSWETLRANDLSIRFNPDANGEYPHFAFIRVKMKTTNSSYAPYLESLKVIVDMDTPREMYVRTMRYNPKITPMLGASAWSKFGSKFETDPQVKGSVEIISEKIAIEHFSIITAEELENYTYIDGLDSDKLIDSVDVRYDYLMNDANALDILRENKVYVKPYTYVKNGETITHPMSFEKGIQFDNSPAYPIISANINPFGNGLERSLSEWIDYSFDYDSDVLIFNEKMNRYSENGTTVEEGIAEYLDVGTLEVHYHPIFIQDLTAEDVGIRDDSEGFVLDYFKEEYLITEEDVWNRYVSLKFPSCDPIRSLVIDDNEYFEDIHFTVDYIHRRIEFPIIDIDNSSTLLTENLGKEMYVVYTPNLTDAGLILGYRGIREDTSKQMRIYENYIEYKV